jgi:UDP-sulfoquinovose synthase
VKVLILGVDGYLGWPLALHLTERGHEVFGIDNFMRRSWVKRMGSESVIPIAPMPDRLSAFNIKFDKPLGFDTLSMEDYPALCNLISTIQPEAIVHLAECPSAPYSMAGPHEAAFVMRNNVVGTLYLLHAIRDNAPNAHLVKLGTMGEYGTPPVDIPEGFFNMDFRGRSAPGTVFPRKAGSWYHWSKVHDSMNIMWACEIWGLRSTDLMQGVVYGNWIEAMDLYDSGSLRTRFDIDEAFGTAINRFCAQAVIGHPLTVYGDIGKQTRGFIPLHDSMQCLTLTIENPAEAGEYRVFNQFAETYSILELAEIVAKVGTERYDVDVHIEHLEPPRVEAQEHYYKPDHRLLQKLGYEPDTDIEGNIAKILESLLIYRPRIEELADVLRPKIYWSGQTE